MGHSPLHARVLSLLDQLPSKHNFATMDNLFISAKFLRASWTHEKKVMTAGVCRKEGQGVAKCVEQEPVTTKDEINKVQGTMKAAVLEGDENCKGMVVVSVYDTKPVYLTSNQCTGIQWVEKKRKVWNAETEIMEEKTYYRLEIIDNYNKRMGFVDLADQLREHYRIDYWMRKRKWWWSLFFWAIQVLLTNAWVLKWSMTIIHSSRLWQRHGFDQQSIESG